MNPVIGKVAPTAIVAAILGWCCWPYVEDKGADVAAKTSSPQITRALLEPTVAVALPRDPFHVAAAAKPRPAPTKDAGPADKASAASRPPPKQDAATVLKGLTLSGTFLAGDRRGALINGRFLAQGQRLDVSKNDAEPWILAQVFPYGVVLQSGARRLEVNYPGPGDKPAPAASNPTSDAVRPAKRPESAVQSKSLPQSAPARAASKTKGR